VLELTNNKMAHQKLDYMHYNPIEAGFVLRQEDWLQQCCRLQWWERFIGNNVLNTLMLLVFITRHKYAKLQKQGGMLAPKAGS